MANWNWSNGLRDWVRRGSMQKRKRKNRRKGGENQLYLGALNQRTDLKGRYAEHGVSSKLVMDFGILLLLLLRLSQYLYTTIHTYTYTKCEYMISGKRQYLATGSLERLPDEMFFIALSIYQHLYFSSFHPSLTWFTVAGPPFIFLSWPPPFSVITISWNRSLQPRRA